MITRKKHSCKKHLCKKHKSHHICACKANIRKIKCEELTADEITACEGFFEQLEVDNLSVNNLITPNKNTAYVFDCNNGIGKRGIIDPVYGYAARIISDVVDLTSVYGPWNTNLPIVKGLSAVSALISDDDVIKIVRVNNISTSVKNLTAKNLLCETVAALFIVFPNQFPDGTYGYIVGTDGVPITAEQYANGIPNNKINYKDVGVAQPFNYFTSYTLDLDINDNQIDYINKLINEYGLESFEIPSKIEIDDSEQFQNLPDIIPPSNKICAWWIVQNTTYPNMSQNNASQSSVIAPLFKGTNNSISAVSTNVKIF